MTTKHLYVSSAVQVALFKNVILPHLQHGFWKNHRPADHATQWLDVSVEVTSTNLLGPVGFKPPRLYNFVNPDFIGQNEDELVSVARAVKPSSTFRSVKKELIELSRIVGGRLADRAATPTKANRGNNRISAAVDEARSAINTSAGAVKRTAIKKSTVEIIKTSSGATVRRVTAVRS